MAMKDKKPAVYQLMSQVISDYIDRETGEINITELAEYAADVNGDLGNDGDIPEEYFELAASVEMAQSTDPRERVEGERLYRQVAKTFGGK